VTQQQWTCSGLHNNITSIIIIIIITLRDSFLVRLGA